LIRFRAPHGVSVVENHTGGVVKFSHVSVQQFSLVWGAATSYSALRRSVDGCHINPVRCPS
jgi:hypothetical protein